MSMPDQHAAGQGTSIVYAVSSPSGSVAAALAQAAGRLQEAAAAEGAAEILTIDHSVTVVSAGDDDAGIRTAFTGRSRPREFVVSVMATIRA